MRILFDSSSLVELERKNPRALRAFSLLAHEERMVSCVSVSELLVGAYLSTERHAKEQVIAALEFFDWIALDEAVAFEAAKITAWKLTNKAYTDFADDAIAATAITQRCNLLITENKKHFDIPALKGKVKSFADF